MRYFKYVSDNYRFGLMPNHVYKFTDTSDILVSDIYTLTLAHPLLWQEVSEEEYLKQEGSLPDKSTNIKPYYKGKSSLYLFAEEYGLNSYEFEVIKRIVRCRHKGEWMSDLIKTKQVIDIYINEQKYKYEGRDLEVNERF